MTKKILYRVDGQNWTTSIKDVTDRIKTESDEEEKKIEVQIYTLDVNTHRICSKCCQIQPVDNFYRYKNVYTSPCKLCLRTSNLNRWRIKTGANGGTGLIKLDEEKKAQLLIEMEDHEIPLKKVAENAGITYACLRLWVKNGQLKARPKKEKPEKKPKEKKKKTKKNN